MQLKESRTFRLTYAFTLAEVLIVLTILGIIAAVSMVTLKPAEFKAKGLKVAAKKALYDIDTATTEILVNDSTMSGDTVVIPSAYCSNAIYLKGLYKKYLNTINRSPSSWFTANQTICLKSGACVEFDLPGTFSTAIPGATNTTRLTSDCGIIFIDVNDADTPNAYGTDRFAIPLNATGIVY